MRRMAAMALVIGLAVVLAAGCRGAAEQSGSSEGKPEGARSGESYSPNIDPANFVAKVDNEYFPLKPGTTYVYEGKTEEGTERNEVTVTGDTRQVMGVDCTVVWDRVWVDGKLAEGTYDWYAQDKAGNVWYFGEDSKEYENGKVVSTKGSWEAGVDGAKPGIIMQADPRVGETYRQEYYEGKAEDMAKVLSLNESATVPYGSYDHLLLTKDWNPLEPGVVEQKYYARGVGNVLEVGVKGNSDRVELIEVREG